MKILLVEDDEMIGESLQSGLRKSGFCVEWFRDGRSAELALGSETYDAVLLDLSLPVKSGLEVLAHLRRRGDDTPVLIITARDGVGDTVTGLDAGADDYLSKPFDLDVVRARLRALLRRRAGRAHAQLINGSLTLDPATHEVTYQDKCIMLPAREFAVLHALMERPGAILSRAQLEDRLYSMSESVESNSVEVRVHHLRRKLAADVIVTVRGVGYVIPKAR